MSGVASNPVSPPRYQRHLAQRPRSDAKRSSILEIAMQHFAEQSYHSARVGDIGERVVSSRNFRLETRGDHRGWTRSSPVDCAY